MSRDGEYKLTMFCFTATLLEALEDVPAEIKSEVANGLLDLMSQMKAQASHFTLAHISRGLHRDAERLLKAGKERAQIDDEIRCESGCAHCCHLAVAIAEPEAHELLEAAAAKGIVIDQARLTRQAQYKTDQSWLDQTHEERRCVFLGQDNRCQVYEARPLACRKYFSVAPPELCNIDRYPKRQIPIWYDVHTEMLATAAMTQFETGFLAEMLLHAQRKRGSHAL